MPANKSATSKPKLTVVPEDPAAAYAFLMTTIREINALGLEGGEIAELLDALSASERMGLQKAMAYLEKLKTRLQKEIDARADDQAP